MVVAPCQVHNRTRDVEREEDLIRALADEVPPEQAAEQAAHHRGRAPLEVARLLGGVPLIEEAGGLAGGGEVLDVQDRVHEGLGEGEEPDQLVVGPEGVVVDPGEEGDQVLAPGEGVDHREADGLRKWSEGVSGYAKGLLRGRRD